MKDFYSICLSAVFVVLAYAWLGLGSKGAENVVVAWAWLHAGLSVWSFTLCRDDANWRYPPGPKAMLMLYAAYRVTLIGTFVWNSAWFTATAVGITLIYRTSKFILLKERAKDDELKGAWKSYEAAK